MSAAPPVLLHHSSSLDHDTGAHPEQPARIVAIERELALRGWLGFERVSSPPAERAALEAVHPVRHIELIERLAARGGARIDADTVVSAGSFTAALHASGGAVALVFLIGHFEYLPFTIWVCVYNFFWNMTHPYLRGSMASFSVRFAMFFARSPTRSRSPETRIAATISRRSTAIG